MKCQGYNQQGTVGADIGSDGYPKYYFLGHDE